MTKILFLHGNGGTFQDGTPLREALEKRGLSALQFVSPDLYSCPELSEEIAGDAWIVITHSWGAFYLLSQWKFLHQKIKKVIFVNPYLFTETPLSPLAMLMLSIPVLGDFLLSRNHKKGKDEFLQKMLWPQTEKEVSYFKPLQEQLKDFSLWKKAVVTKINQQAYPLAPMVITEVPAIAIIGEADRVMNNERQLSVLKTIFPNLKIQAVHQAGHGILWTHLIEIIKEIEL